VSSRLGTGKWLTFFLQCTLYITFTVEKCKRLREFEEIRKRLHEFEELHTRLREFEKIRISRQSCRGDCE
jgi:hypothetical protein